MRHSLGPLGAHSLAVGTVHTGSIVEERWPLLEHPITLGGEPHSTWVLGTK